METNIAWKREETLNLQEMNELNAYDRYPAEAGFDLRSPKELKNQGFVFANGPEASSILKVREILKKREEPVNSFPVNEERERGEFLFWSVQCLEVIKVSSAKRILKRLDGQYAKLFKEQISGLEEDFSEKQRFFNSKLHYLIAATDGYEDTLGHSQRVASYSALLTNALGIEDKNFCVDIERGALLHDIGKIGIPESILRKAGSLTKREKEIIKEHPILGYEMIEEYDFLKGAALVVLYHHERYDGCGYPYGLAGEEIPLEARIFALADTLDAITSDRPYSRRKSFLEAYREIEKSQGGQFDPLLVDVFLSIPIEKWQRIKARAQISLPSLTLH
jgi:putative nucleotidyltransferase with HDIG domain